ncbi:hypothetical protein D3C71_234780 [compost metagenome]
MEKQVKVLKELQVVIGKLMEEYDNSPDEFGMRLDYLGWFGKDLIEISSEIATEIERLQP